MPRRGKYNKISPNDRARILKPYEDGKDWRECADALGINVRTAHEWIKKDQPLPKPKGSLGFRKRTAEIESTLVEWVEENATITLANLADSVFEQFHIRVCVNTIKNWLDGKLFSVKAVRPQSCGYSWSPEPSDNLFFFLFDCSSDFLPQYWISPSHGTEGRRTPYSR
ncbi:unnamed protein product [Ceutorhynchus assimilis]|uniref:Homeodomain-like domain-containing protein n=1 Tax=Ceutorhynchus assimilis TaxID=467358 RepID=A0A9N9MF11_9CUCU|nr:unnamed protein product [Ceutorhynchus assimilis]